MQRWSLPSRVRAFFGMHVVPTLSLPVMLRDFAIFTRLGMVNLHLPVFLVVSYSSLCGQFLIH